MGLTAFYLHVVVEKRKRPIGAHQKMRTLDVNRQIGTLALAGAMALGAAACTKEEVGTLAGAGLGAWVGSEIGGHGTGQVIGAAVGTLAGAWAGREIGRSLDRADQLAMERTTQDALENGASGSSKTWTNPDTGHSGTVTPQPAFRDGSSDQVCREYQQTVTVAGQKETAYGTACRQPDGSWRIANS